MTSEPSTVDHGVVRFGPDGLVPAVLQQVGTDRVLMVGFMNADALAATRQTGLVHFWSRSRARLWQKGETSGNVSRVVETRVNCEQNSLLLLVEQVGAICHDGYPTCFYRRVDDDGELATVEPRVFDPADVYGMTDGSAVRPPLPEVVAEWFSAYEYLRDHDLVAVSSTSGRLRGNVDLRGRVTDELTELAGVLSGSHRHGEFADDVALESGQVLYWLTLVAVAQGQPESAIDITAALRSPGTSSIAGLAGERITLLALAATWQRLASSDLVAQSQTTVTAVARIGSLVGVDVARLIADDLRELRTRPYLAEYFGRQRDG